MKRSLLCLILIVIALLSVTVAAAKVDPYVEDPEAEWGDLSEPTALWEPDALAVHAGRLEADDVDAFTVSFERPKEAWSLEVVVPVCGNYFKGFFPSVAVIGAGLDVPDTEALPFELPEGMGAVVFSEDRYIEQYLEKEHRSVIPSHPMIGVATYFNTTRNLDIPEAGEYLIAIFEQDGNTGAYMLRTGDGHDGFAPRSHTEFQAAADLLYSGEWMGEDCDAPMTALNTEFAVLSGGG